MRFWIKAPMHHEVPLKTSDFEKLLQPYVISRGLTWVQDTLPRTSLRWSDGVGSRCLMKLVHNSSILIQFWSLSGFLKKTIITFLNWVCFLETTRRRGDQALSWAHTCPTCRRGHRRDRRQGSWALNLFSINHTAEVIFKIIKLSHHSSSQSFYVNVNKNICIFKTSKSWPA